MLRVNICSYSRKLPLVVFAVLQVIAASVIVSRVKINVSNRVKECRSIRKATNRQARIALVPTEVRPVNELHLAPLPLVITQARQGVGRHLGVGKECHIRALALAQLLQLRVGVGVQRRHRNEQYAVRGAAPGCVGRDGACAEIDFDLVCCRGGVNRPLPIKLGRPKNAGDSNRVSGGSVEMVY